MLKKLFEEIFDSGLDLSGNESESAFFRSICERMNISNVAYLVLNLPMHGKRGHYFHNTYSADWALRYETQGYVGIDPIVRRGMTALMPVDWSDFSRLTPQQKTFFGEAAEFKIGNKGLTFPMRGLHGETAVFSITADMSGKDWSHFKRTHMREMRVLGDFFHQRIVANIADAMTDEKPVLTNREAECLKWSAEGKSKQDIADVLNVSVRTVRFFLESARHKLGCLNTTHTVASAMHRGLI